MPPARGAKTKKTKSAIAELAKKTDVPYHVKVQQRLTGQGVVDIVDFLPSGILTLDLALTGGRGWPGGRFHEICGAAAGGKDLLMAMTAAEVQQRGGHVKVYNLERRFAKGVYRMCRASFDPSCFAIDAFDDLNAVLDNLNLDLQLAALDPSDTWKMFVINSLGVVDKTETANETLVSEEAKDRSSANKPMGIAEIISRAHKKAGGFKMIESKRIIVFYINQVRLDYAAMGRMGFGGGQAYKSGGGEALRHICECKVQLEDRKFDKEDRTFFGNDDPDFPNGKFIDFHVKKTAGPPDRHGQLVWGYAFGALEEWVFFSFLKENGIIQYSGKLSKDPRFAKTTGNKPGLYTFKGELRTELDWVRHWFNDPKARKQAESAVREVYIKRSLYNKITMDEEYADTMQATLESYLEEPAPSEKKTKKKQKAVAFDI